MQNLAVTYPQNVTREDLEVFLSYPASRSQMKVAGGSLEHTNRIKSLGGIRGSSLPLTVQKVGSIVLVYLNEMQNQLQSVLSSQGEELELAKKKFKKIWNDSSQFYAALACFKSVYEENNDSSHNGLEELKLLYNDFCSTWFNIVKKIPKTFFASQASLSISILETNQPISPKEIEALLTFPASTKNDQLKILSNTLQQSNSRHNYYGLYGSQLPETINRVTQIARNWLQKIDGELHPDLNKTTVKPLNYREAYQRITELWNEGEQLFLALTYFKGIYIKRYEMESNHEGLSALKELYESFTAEWINLLEDYTTSEAAYIQVSQAAGFQLNDLSEVDFVAL